jgi:hypothetical protein
MEKHDYALSMQKEMAAEIERSNPKFVVVVRVRTSWLTRRDSERYILQWSDEYVKKDYDLVGVVDVMSDGNSTYRWYEDARARAPKSPSNLLIYQRK